MRGGAPPFPPGRASASLEANHVHEVAFPAISTGAPVPGGSGSVDAVDAAVEHLAGSARSVTSIVFVLHTNRHFTAFAAALAESVSAMATRPRG